MTTEQLLSGQGPVVATAGKYYRNMRYLMFIIILGMGVWFLRDGFSKWPAENAAVKAAGQDRLAHTDTDILLNRVLGMALPPLGLLLMAWWLYNSRGAYRLDGQTLQAPGHAPITLEQIRKVDKRLWDRKGIAYLEYELDGQTRRIKLDDFVYDAVAIREIFRRAEEHLTLAQPAAAADSQ